MRICIAGFVCNPTGGTEAGVAWNWAKAYSDLGHEVTILTHISQRENFTALPESIEHRSNFEGIEIHFFGEKATKPNAPTSLISLIRMYFLYMAWMKSAMKYSHSFKFGFIHHVSWSTCRTITKFLSRSDFVVWGPLGGGHVARIRDVPRRDKVYETIRNISVIVSRILNSIHRVQRSQNIIALSTNYSTFKYLKSIGLRDVRYELADGVREVMLEPKTKVRNEDFDIELIWAGRVVASKRPDLAVEILEEIRKLGINAKLSFLGNGNYMPQLKAKISESNCKFAIEVLGPVSWGESTIRISNADFLLFTSVLYSPSPAALEAASFGVPTLGLRLNGLGDLFPSTFVLGPRHFVGEKEISRIIATECLSLISGTNLQFSQNEALKFARQQLWANKAKRVIQMVEEK